MDNDYLAADHQLPSSTTPPLHLLIIFFFLAAAAGTKILIKRKTSNSSTQQLPPGPWKLPIIGNLHQLLGAQPPHRRLMDLARKHGPLMHLQLGETSNVVVSSPELAKEILKTHDLNFANRPLYPVARILSYDARDMAFAPYGDYFRHIRKVTSEELLGRRRVKSLRPVISSYQGVVVNLCRMLDALGNTLICRVAFGKMTPKQQEAFLPLKEEMVKAYGGFGLGNFFPSSKLIRLLSGTERAATKLHKEMDAMLESIVGEHMATRKARSDDLLDVLLNLMEEEEKNQELGFSITIVEIKAIILDVILSGSDTSTGTVAWVMSELMRHPRVMEKAQGEVRQTFDAKGMPIDEAGIEELNYLKAVVKETFRLRPITPLLVPRECREAVVVGGYQIPEKTRVMVNSLAIGQDSRYWTDPEKFSPERFVDLPEIDHRGTCFEFLPFGAGRRMCPGMTFGSTVIELLLANLLYHFDWQLPDGIEPRDVDMSEKFGLALRKEHDLHLIPIPYYP
ncbi:unnamed protein product [Linum tenue]|uniref:Cytochrome P450 n=1 Tax=Linum tenue TaxID=586396 RepID=A0AAV0GP84_9ROSI|nr:unnamed protein product [Linum tenue]